MEEVTFNIILIFMLVLIQLSKDFRYSIDFQLHDFQQMFNRFSMDVPQMDFRFVKCHGLLGFQSCEVTMEEVISNIIVLMRYRRSLAYR